MPRNHDPPQGLTGLLILKIKSAKNLKGYKNIELTNISVESYTNDPTNTEPLATSKALRIQTPSTQQEDESIVVWNEKFYISCVETCMLKFRIFVKEKRKKKGHELAYGVIDLVAHYGANGTNSHLYTGLLHPQGVLACSLQFLHVEDVVKEDLVQIGQGLEASLNFPKNMKTFGGSIETQGLAGTQYIPMLILRCIKEVEAHGLEVEGIYRLSGNKAIIDELKLTLEKQRDVPLEPGHVLKSGKALNIHCVTGVLKQFFTELEEPLMTEKYYHYFLAAADMLDGDAKNDNIMVLINQLPTPNLATFHFLISHLKKIEAQKDKNAMTNNALSTCFGPAILYTKDLAKWNPTKGNQLLEYILENWSAIYPFGDEVHSALNITPQTTETKQAWVLDLLQPAGINEIRLNKPEPRGSKYDNDYDYEFNYEYEYNTAAPASNFESSHRPTKKNVLKGSRSFQDFTSSLMGSRGVQESNSVMATQSSPPITPTSTTTKEEENFNQDNFLSVMKNIENRKFAQLGSVIDQLSGVIQQEGDGTVLYKIKSNPTMDVEDTLQDEESKKALVKSSTVYCSVQKDFDDNSSAFDKRRARPKHAKERPGAQKMRAQPQTPPPQMPPPQIPPKPQPKPQKPPKPQTPLPAFPPSSDLQATNDSSNNLNDNNDNNIVTPTNNTTDTTNDYNYYENYEDYDNNRANDTNSNNYATNGYNDNDNDDYGNNDGYTDYDNSNDNNNYNNNNDDNYEDSYRYSNNNNNDIPVGEDNDYYDHIIEQTDDQQMIEHLTKENQEIKSELRRLKDDLEAMAAENRKLRSFNMKLNLENRKLIGQSSEANSLSPTSTPTKTREQRTFKARSQGVASEYQRTKQTRTRHSTMSQHYSPTKNGFRVSDNDDSDDDDDHDTKIKKTRSFQDISTVSSNIERFQKLIELNQK